MMRGNKSTEDDWEKEFNNIWNEDRFREIGFTYNDFDFIKTFIRSLLEKERGKNKI